MDELVDYLPRLQSFLRESQFAERGAVMTDLDGTAVHEFEGRVILSRSVELGLERVHAAGREVLINTLRFPLSIMRVFGDQWRRASGSDPLVVSLKGSLIGRIVAAAGGELAFEEIEAFTLTAEELAEVLTGVRGLCEQGAEDLLVFFYPRLKNVIVSPQDGHIVALLDWDNCLSAPPPYWDLAIAIHDVGPDDKEAFLEGYGLSPRRFENLAPVLRVLNLLNYAWAIEQAMEAGQRQRVAWLKARLRGVFDVAL